ncbi:hypothetical protein [Mongoliitalea lutea]|uniref:Lipoprotein n=1 Tax=Mongoliitalea lutea TaxID=849756 RepID=A0A8J3CWA7_9BACT|nr:hypothetical protein [Mongoliitalea lutea]GHB34186.1 hypothetical protein GCM10008106_14290 [Mongoliitalea lutea]
MNIYKLIIRNLILLCLITVAACSRSSIQEERMIYEEVMSSLIESWRLGAKFNLNKIQVHDFVSYRNLNYFIEGDALIFLLPGDTCHSCLDRELNKFLEWDISVDKYILGLNTNNNYLLDLKRRYPEIKGFFVIQNKDDFKNLVLLPHIVFYHHSEGTYLNYGAVKSGINHFNYFKSVVENLEKP